MPSGELISHSINIEYLTGFHSSNAILLRTGKIDYLFTDGRYIEKARAVDKAGKGRIGSFKVVDMGTDLKEDWQKILKKHRLRTLEFEGNHLTVNKWERFKKLSPGVKWKVGKMQTEALRAQKDASEIRQLKKSQHINEQIFYSIRRALNQGVTELEIAKQIKQSCYNYGADGISFEPIVCFGSHSSMPHHQNTSRKLKRGDPVLIDMGVLYQGYASDMTRMVFTQSPTAEQEKIYNLVLEAQESAIRAMKPGQSCKKTDEIARNLLRRSGYEEYFVHSLGHGIGLEVHEAPTLSHRSTDRLKPGMVVTSEPGIYLPGRFGVRIEDMILITAKGHVNLTKAPKRIQDCILR